MAPGRHMSRICSPVFAKVPTFRAASVHFFYRQQAYSLSIGSRRQTDGCCLLVLSLLR